MIASMTGFASARGAREPFTWQWELRSVNAKGLDLRLRAPDWLDGLDAALRAELGKAVKRGNVTLSLRLTRSDSDGAYGIDPAGLDAAIAAILEVQSRAAAQGLELKKPKASDLLTLRGVWETSAGEEDNTELVAQLKAEFSDLVADFLDMRRREGAMLEQALTGYLDQISALSEQAEAVAESRKDAMAETLKANLDRVLQNADGADPDRVAQELALLAVKADVAEEIVRLRAHVAAARDLLEKGGPVGRKLDFLMQEFNREANTLCAKSQSTALTAIGLELKAVIDQIREQVQNVE